MGSDSIPDASRFFVHTALRSTIKECLEYYGAWYGQPAADSLAASFAHTENLYAGKYPGYAACNTDYHDWNHTQDVFVATLRILDGYNLSEKPLDAALAQDICVAALLHDSGYIQESGDTSGTGAKHTKHHVPRSAAFARNNAGAFGLSHDQAARVGRLILVTDISSGVLCDDTPGEALAGAMLGSADLLGQMADRTYLEKLLFLYYEFKEAGFPGYDTEFDMLKKTLGFYEYTKTRLSDFLLNTQRYAEPHFAERQAVKGNPYVESIERQMQYLREIMDDNTTNFRKKLKRLDLEESQIA